MKIKQRKKFSSSHIVETEKQEFMRI
uniref:Uncharacterized protein n=1 Tax=Rhizophora mucronata TaxID=61149 RepID=A0A2P2QVJ6_RHIMU